MLNTMHPIKNPCLGIFINIFTFNILNKTCYKSKDTSIKESADNCLRYCLGNRLCFLPLWLLNASPRPKSLLQKQLLESYQRLA